MSISFKSRASYLAAASGLILLLITGSLAASQPASGSLGAGSTTALTWNGTALGGSSPEAETACVEGITCDTFLLSLSGTPADWDGKNVRVSLSWLLPVTDYDLYIHKDSITGPLVANSGNAATTA